MWPKLKNKIRKLMKERKEIKIIIKIKTKINKYSVKIEIKMIKIMKEDKNNNILIQINKRKNRNNQIK